MFLQFNNLAININHIESLLFVESDLSAKDGYIFIKTVTKNNYEFEISYDEWQKILKKVAS